MMRGFVHNSDLLLVFRSHNYSNCFIHHDLVGTVAMQIHTGHEGCLCGMGLCVGEGGGGER